MLDEWLAEEDEALLAAILKVDHEVVLPEGDFIYSKLGEKFWYEVAVTSDL